MLKLHFLFKIIFDNKIFSEAYTQHFDYIIITTNHYRTVNRQHSTAHCQIRQQLRQPV